MFESEGNETSKASKIFAILALFVLPRVFSLIAIILGVIGWSTAGSNKDASIGIGFGLALYILSFTNF